MAKGTREVELTVRAKNEATKALNSITGALDELKKAQTSVAVESGKTGSTLTQLGQVIGRLNQQLGGTSAMDRMAQSSTKAATAVGRLEQSISGLTQEQQRLDTEVKSTEQSLTGLNAKAAQLESTLREQSSATKVAREQLTGVNQSVTQASSALAKAVRDSSRYESQLQKLEAKLAATQQKHRDLTQEILRAENPTQRLIRQFETADAAMERQSAALAKMRREYANSRGSVAELERSLATLQAQQQASATNATQAAQAQQNTARALKQTQQEAKTASTALLTVQSAAADNADALTRQNAALDKARTELTAVQAASSEADAALGKIAGTVRMNLLRSLQEAQAGLQKYREAWRSATADIAAAVKGGASVKDPTPELAASIQQAQQAKTAYGDMQVALQRMRTALREAGTDVNGLARAQQVFVAALGQVRSASQSATSSVNGLGNAHQNGAAAADKNAAANKKVSNAMDLLAGKGRSAMSWTQRLRGELLSLTASVVGVYAAIQQLQGVTQTFLDIEAANTRMSVAFEGNAAVVGREMRFIRSEADRLKIDFRLLAAEYSKFAIATQGTALEGDQTRKIFIQLAEAFRVAKLSSDQMQGAFLAITQMVNKGNVSMEELRQQLGERLYGAFKMAGQAMGLSGAELSKLIATGELATEEFLPKFAEQVNKTFGPQLPKALETLTADIGDFSNSVTRAQERVAKGGFVEGLRSALQSLSAFMDSSRGEQFFTNLGAAAGKLLEVLGKIPDYLNEIVFVLSLLVGSKVASALTGMGGRFVALRAALAPLPAQIRQANAAITATGTAAATTAPLLTRLQTSFVTLGTTTRTFVAGMTAARAGAVALTGALGLLRGAMALLGGLPGLLVTGLSLAFSYWLSSTNDVIDATDEHKRQLQEIIDKYSVAKDKAGEWAKEVKGVSLAGAEQTLGDLRKQLQDQLEPIAQQVAGKLGGTIFLGRGGMGEVGKQIADLTESLMRGETSVTAYAKALDQIYRTTADEQIKKVIRAADGLIRKAKDSEKALADQGVVVKSLGGDISSVIPLMEELGVSLQSVVKEAGLAGDEQVEAADQAAAAQKKLNEQIQALKDKIPSLADELKYLEGIKSIDKILQTAEAIKGLDKTSESYKRLLELARQAKTELQLTFDEKQFKGLREAMSGMEGSVDASAKLLRRFESFRSTPYWDVNAFRVGFGSDTVTLADGSIQKVVQGITVTLADANRDLTRRIGEFQSTIKGQIGADRFNSFSSQQQAALTSIAYNYGSLPERIVKAVREGSAEEIADAIRGLGGDNGGINRSRRNQEAFLFQNGADPDTQIKRQEQQLAEQEKAEQRRLEKAQEYHDQLARTLEVKQAESEADKHMTREQTIQVELLKAENAAKKAGTQLSQEERDRITEITGKQWDRVNATRAQEEAEKRINLLTQTRRDILTQMDQALNRGDLQAYALLREQLTAVDDQLKQLIADAIKMWQAMGDNEKAQAAIMALKAQQGALQEVRDKTRLLASDFGEVFGRNLLSAADNFLAKIRETGDVWGAAKEAFQQFASDFLLQIAQMILKQAIFNALSSVFGAAKPGSFGAGVMSVFQFHTGGIVGSAGAATTAVNPGIFANAVRYHNGGQAGQAGLKPNEIPAVLERGEEILPETDPRHINNGGAVADQSVKIVNAIDAGSFVSAGVADVQGQRAILNYMRANRSAVKGALGL